MAYLTRADGEHFIIPSYREVLKVQKKSQLKKEVTLLSQNYGEYITLQKKSPMQFEVAFSAETGYLLGESIWQYFKKPSDMIYCEAIPDTTEAILVIVKAGSVYLDGSFPLESIPEELIIFLTQENNFEIYTYGDVPISAESEAGKFSFDASSVKSFTKLDKPVFPTLPLYKMYQLQLVDTVLRSQGIGVFPTKQLIAIVILGGLAYLGYIWFIAKPPPPPPQAQVNPYQGFYDTLTSPAADQAMEDALNKLNWLMQVPGWRVQKMDYASGSLSASMVSKGGNLQGLLAFGEQNNMGIQLQKTGVTVSVQVPTVNRAKPNTINNLKQVIANLMDRLQMVYPGNNLDLGDMKINGPWSQTEIKISLNEISPALLAMIGKQFSGLPLVLQAITLTVNDSSLTGSITLEVLGN